VLVPGAGGGVLVPGVGGGVTVPGDDGGVVRDGDVPEGDVVVGGVVDGAVVPGTVELGGGVTVEGDGGTLGVVAELLDGRGVVPDDAELLLDVVPGVVPVDGRPLVVPVDGTLVLVVPGLVVEVLGTPGGVLGVLEPPTRNRPTVPWTGAAASPAAGACCASAAPLGITISTRRLFARPSGERLLATGRSGPTPCVVNRSPATPWDTR